MSNQDFANDIVDKIKSLIKKGNVSRIYVWHDGDKILDIPVTAGALGTVLLAAAAPWALILGAIAAVGTDCCVEVVKDNGEIITVYGKH
jgi:repressor of nif and glnA expression